MSSNKSTNLGLHLWEGEDDFLRTEFNENFQAIDTGIKAEETARKSAIQAETKARQSAIQAETKARQTAIQELKNSISSTGGSASQAVENLRNELTPKITAAQQAADAAQETADAAYCPTFKPYAVGSYRGTGTYGSSNPTVINVGFKPTAFVIFDSGGSCAGVYPNTKTSMESALTWTSTGVSIYSNDSEKQMNYKGHTYSYIVFR